MSEPRAADRHAAFLTGALIACGFVTSALFAAVLGTLTALGWAPPGLMLLGAGTVLGCVVTFLLIRYRRNERRPYAAPAMRLAAG